MIRQIITFELLVGFLLYFFLGCIGGVAKYIYTVTIDAHKANKMPVLKTAICSLVTAFGMPVVERHFGEKIGIELLILIAFIMGVVGFELFGKFSTISNIYATLKEAQRIRQLDFDEKDKNERKDE